MSFVGFCEVQHIKLSEGTGDRFPAES